MGYFLSNPLSWETLGGGIIQWVNSSTFCYPSNGSFPNFQLLSYPTNERSMQLGMQDLIPKEVIWLFSLSAFLQICQDRIEELALQKNQNLILSYRQISREQIMPFISLFSLYSVIYCRHSLKMLFGYQKQQWEHGEARGIVHSLTAQQFWAECRSPHCSLLQPLECFQ